MHRKPTDPLLWGLLKTRGPQKVMLEQVSEMPVQETSENRLTHLTRDAYFVWGRRLYYVVDLTADGMLYRIEDCRSLELEWVPRKLLEKTKEVKCSKLPLNNW
jgi:hypothetical protein